MFKNLIRHSLRSFKRQRSYILINIFGLSVGIACSLLIALFVLNEASYDRYNVKKDRIYRLVLNGKIGGQEIIGAYTCAAIGPTMLREVPEVEDYLRLNPRGPTVVEYEDQTFTEDHLVEADSTFFNFFTIPLIKGDPSSVLNQPGRAVVSESTAKRMFGDKDPIDKAIRIGNDTARFIISGIIADIPGNSHFEANILTSFMTNPRSRDPIWLSNSYSTYLLFKPNTSYTTVQDKIPALLEKYVGPEVQRFMGISLEEFMAQGNKYMFFLQNLTDIHLDPTVQQQFKEASDPKYLRIFGIIAVLIILIAAINFMNLATAQASRRSKEVGIKKISGSTRGMLITQFLSESFILSLIALIIAVIIIKLTLPYFNGLLGSDLKLGLLSKWYTIPALLVFTVLVGLLSGSYPAFVLSSFNPYEVLKGSVRGSVQNATIRRILVVFQFAVSILLITGTLIMYRQINFMLNKDIGFDKKNMLVINRAGALESRVEAFKEAVMKIPGVINVASSTAVPGRNNNNNGYGLEGRRDESFLMTTNWIDYDYIDSYGMTLLKGRNFDKTHSTDRDACIINEAAAINFNITSIENARFLQPRDSGRYRYLQVIGVVKNFNFESLRNPIQPYVFQYKGNDNLWGYITVKLSPEYDQQTITGIENRWKEFTSNDPLQYYFVDEDFEQMYIQEKQNARMAVIFSVLAIIIAGMGLFGLTSFTVEQRTKEIGVRKAMGSSVSGIYFVISREIIILVSISALIAWPVIYIIVKNWLENFYFRINPGIFSFVSGLFIALIIAIFTISFRIIKAARINPARSLKYE